MLLRNLICDNRKLIYQAVYFYKAGLINSDSFVVDYNNVIKNANYMLSEAKKKKIDLFFMCKQLGRNPYIAKELVNCGYKGAVAVDWREAYFYMKIGIPLMNVGYISQIPNTKLYDIMKYGVKYITIYSISKLDAINRIAECLGIVQEVMLHVYDKDDIIYPNQEGGVAIQDLNLFLKESNKYKNIKISAITSFPCFLYQKNRIHKTPNLNTLKKAKEMIGSYIKIDAPSNNNVALMKQLESGEIDIMEPGHSFTGTTPFNIDFFGEDDYEKISYLYITEVSHNYEEISLCFGGGSYFNSYLENALVISGNNYYFTKILSKKYNSIDYYISIEGSFEPGSIVIMCYRAQMFISRSDIVILNTDFCKLIGVFDGKGNKI